MSKVAKQSGILMYKDRPFVRQGNTIYYGNMADPYIILIQVLDTVQEKDLSLSSRVSVQLQRTNPDLKTRDRVVKKSEKSGLYPAMDVGAIWLERALAE